MTFSIVARSADGTSFGVAVWVGIENYEERLVPGKIDPLVLEKLR